jgi:hypothetical protein
MRGRFYQGVSMSRWMIDDFGNMKPAGAAALAEIIGIPCPDAEDDVARLEDYAILNVGLVVVQDKGTSVRIKCRPAVLSPRAFSTLSHWLLEHPHVPALVEWFNETWDTEDAPDARTAVNLVSYIVELKQRAPVTPTDRIRAQPSVQAARHWQRVKASVGALTKGKPDGSAYARVLDPLFFGRWMVGEVDAGGGGIDFVACGTGYPVLDPFFSAREPTRTLDWIKDDQYRAWVVDGFIDVVKTGRPRFDDVDAIIDWPRFGYLRTRYWRVLVPLTESAGRWRVLSASGNDSGIDLRPQDIKVLS